MICLQIPCNELLILPPREAIGASRGYCICHPHQGTGTFPASLDSCQENSPETAQPAPSPPPQSSPVSKCHLPRTPQTGHISPASGQSRARTLHSSNGTLGIQTQPQEVINWLPLPHKPWQLAVMEMDLVVIRCVEGNGFQGKAAGSEQLAVGSPILHQPQMGLAPILLSASPLRHHKPAHLSYRGSQSWASTPQ